MYSKDALVRGERVVSRDYIRIDLIAALTQIPGPLNYIN